MATLLTIWEWLEDFDAADLDDYERKEQLRNAVIEYNERNLTDYNPDRTVETYEARKRNYCDL